MRFRTEPLACLTVRALVRSGVGLVVLGAAVPGYAQDGPPTLAPEAAEGAPPATEASAEADAQPDPVDPARDAPPAPDARPSPVAPPGVALDPTAAMGGIGASGFTIGGYGEAFVNMRFFGPDPTIEYDPGTYRETSVDLARLVFFVGYTFTSWLRFQSEIEIEHGGTGATMEIEWDEFGEYEQEIEQGGELVIEQAFIELMPLSWLGIRAGRLLVPVGTITGFHTPIQFASVRRPESEAHLLPSTWHETGIEVWVRAEGFQVQLQEVTALDSTGFSSSTWIAGGTQRRFELALGNDWATALRVDYFGIPGLLVGVSGYAGNTTGNRPKPDMAGIDAWALVGDVHLRLEAGPIRLRALGMIGWLTNAAAITAKNASLSRNLGVPRTPVGRGAYAYYVEATLDVLALIAPGTQHRLDVFLRYDGYDSMWEPPQEGGIDNPLLQRQVLTAGLNYFPHPRVVFKLEYVSRWINRDDRWARHQHEMSVGLGFVL